MSETEALHQFGDIFPEEGESNQTLGLIRTWLTGHLNFVRVGSVWVGGERKIKEVSSNIHSLSTLLERKASVECVGVGNHWKALETTELDSHKERLSLF